MFKKNNKMKITYFNDEKQKDDSHELHIEEICTDLRFKQEPSFIGYYGNGSFEMSMYSNSKKEVIKAAKEQFNEYIKKLHKSFYEEIKNL